MTAEFEMKFVFNKAKDEARHPPETYCRNYHPPDLQSSLTITSPDAGFVAATPAVRRAPSVKPPPPAGVNDMV